MGSTVLDLDAALALWAGGEVPATEAVAAAEDLLRGPAVESATWRSYLDLTGRPSFLQSLSDRAARTRWAETTFRAIRASSYSMRTLLASRAAEHPDRILFEDDRELDAPTWTYAEVRRYARSIAGVFLTASAAPRVAIFCDNNVDGAAADLACLSEGILVAPLNVNFDAETLAEIFARLAVDIVLTDTDEREAIVAEIAKRLARTIVVFRTGSRAGHRTAGSCDGIPLRRACAELDLSQLDARLGRPENLFAPATVMFTSGSTGEAKGLVFSQYMLLTKRFARAAALPSVGDGEVLLCYLPLFHTFGRYLEMLGTIFWRGTYVFAGNPSAEALIAELGRVRPTGLISVPVRWTQIRDQCIEAMERGGGSGAEELALRGVVGDRLRWGLSAAGWLDPQVFRFFQRHGVDLCSGFGMTEATGGIAMTPPGEYRDGSVGIPLPGIDTRLTGEGELQIRGVYVARPLDPHGVPGSLPRLDPDSDAWLATGDLFRESPGGYLDIVDRIKDIYKNSRGQTVAPQRVEQRFAGVPGFKRVFLAGDHRDYNVLLVVPDRGAAPVSGMNGDQADEYFGQIVSSVNGRLAPYERAVRFSLVERDFDAGRGELTPKGSFRRKVIAANFAAQIEALYGSNYVELTVPPLRVRIPRWFFRDLGILEGDIVAEERGVRNRRNGARLAIEAEEGGVRVGDLRYAIGGVIVDLGLFARQPRLWIGNASLAAFSPCKAGWDVAVRDVSDHVRLPHGAKPGGDSSETLTGATRADDRLLGIHRLSVEALFASEARALAALEGLGGELERGGGRGSVATIRRRLEALAFRKEEEIRALAYQILLLDAPLLDHDVVFPAFIESGLSFLTEASIERIASARRGERRLQALRQRLHSYRTELRWPGTPVRRRQFRRVFRLLADFARHDPNDFAAVQAELASWALFREDPVLARAALREHDELTAWRERQLASSGDTEGPGRRVVFEFGIPQPERRRLERILSDPTFLRHSLAHAFGESDFSWARVPIEGAWVSPMLSHQQLSLYRLGLNLMGGRHFDLLLIVGDVMKRAAVKDTILWLTALSGHALGTPALPRFGAWRRDLGTATVAYVSDLTAWERIRELASQRDVRDGVAARWALRKLYVRAMAGFFRAWDQSGGRIVPGAVTPSNVALPDADFHEGATVLSIAGWKPYLGPLSLVRPLVRTFYLLTEAHYPQTRELLQPAWIFDACIEALGPSRAETFLDALRADLSLSDGAEHEPLFHALLERSESLASRPWLPLPALCAVERFRDWARMNPAATQQAREEMVIQMAHLYRLDRFPDRVRYHLFRHTYFAGFGAAIDDAFDQLIARRTADTRAVNSQLEELSALQSLLAAPADRAVFSRMVFPHAQRAQKLELMALDGAERARVIVRSEIVDDSGSRYVVREPLTAVELGNLYRLILETDYPMHIRATDRQLVIADAEERIVGGLCYRWQEGDVAYVDGIVVAPALTNQGLGGRLLEDFCVRMAAAGARLARTNFFLGGLFTKHGFQVNQRWGGLVRLLGEDLGTAERER